MFSRVISAIHSDCNRILQLTVSLRVLNHSTGYGFMRQKIHCSCNTRISRRPSRKREGLLCLWIPRAKNRDQMLTKAPLTALMNVCVRACRPVCVCCSFTSCMCACVCHVRSMRNGPTPRWIHHDDESCKLAPVFSSNLFLEFGFYPPWFCLKVSWFLESYKYST